MPFPRPCQHSSMAERRRCRRCAKALGVLAGAGLLAATSGAVAYALLASSATGSSPSSSGSLSLTIGANGVGFTQPIANLAPGDVVNRYVTLTSGGTLDAANLTLAVAGTGTSPLTTDPTRGLALSVLSCSGTWTPTTGACSGTTTPLLTGSAVAVLGSPASPIAGTLPAGTIRQLKLSVTLPDQTETTVNGVPPTTTIQGLSTTLTYTFSQTQRPAVTTNS